MLPKRKDVKSFLDRFKYDARYGTFTRVDRRQENGDWITEKHEIPLDDVEFIADVPNMKIGWMYFSASGAPDFRMFNINEDIGPQPGDGYKEGFKLKVKLTNGAGDDVRELASTALGLWKSIDELHSEYEAGAKKNKGKLPLVGIDEDVVIEGKTTTHRPTFRIIKWVARPSDL